MSQEAVKRRDVSFDILKGIGIVGVIVLHASNWSMSRLTTPGSNTWSALFIANRITNIGVPLFLMISALLLARSLSRTTSTGWAKWRPFYGRRLQGLLWPYVVWTVVYWTVRYVFSHPAGFWTDWSGRLKDLLLGKASFHLYFMSVLLQFVLAFPLFFVLLRKFRLGFLPVLVLACAFQELVMIAQKTIRFPYPGSIFLWYLVPLAVGVWLGLNWEVWPGLWRRWWLPFVVAFIATMMWFFTICLREIAKEPFTSDAYKWAHTTFTLSGSLVLLGWSLRWRESTSLSARVFNEFGLNSLQLYLVHPLLLYLMAGSTALGVLRRVPFAPALVVVILVSVSYLIGRAFGWARLDGIVFGRTPPKAAAVK